MFLVYYKNYFLWKLEKKYFIYLSVPPSWRYRWVHSWVSQYLEKIYVILENLAHRKLGVHTISEANARLRFSPHSTRGNTARRHGKNVGLDCWFTADSTYICQSQLIEDNLQFRELLCVRHRNQIYFLLQGWGKVDYDFIWENRHPLHNGSDQKK